MRETRGVTPLPRWCEHADCQAEGECMHYGKCRTRTAAFHEWLRQQIPQAEEERQALRAAARVTQADLNYEVGMPRPASTPEE